jgi:hypothetical protein
MVIKTVPPIVTIYTETDIQTGGCLENEGFWDKIWEVLQKTFLVGASGAHPAKTLLVCAI